MHIFLSVLLEVWNIIQISAFYILLGFFIAGLIYIYIKPEKIMKYFGGRKTSSVIYIALFGIPLPLCSCGVLPTAISFRRQGATRGATLSFLISTPETGIDSIALTYALMDPIITIARPLSAFLTATTAGIIQNFFDETETKTIEDVKDCCKVDRCCDGTNCAPESHARHHGFREKIKAGIKFSFIDLFGDVSGWLAFGLIVAGIISYLVPRELIESYLGGGISSMLIMLIMGIPLYICAVASTPIAAALIAKGASPGAALVFLLAGPATNIASLIVLTRFLGRKAVFIYLFTICICSLLLGWALNVFYKFFKITPHALTQVSTHMHSHFCEWFNVFFAMVFLVLMIYNWILILKKKFS